MNFNTMLMMVISLVFLSFILPIGFVYIVNIGDVNVLFNGENVTLAGSGLDSIITLLTTLVPLAIVIGIVIFYIRGMQT